MRLQLLKMNSALNFAVLRRVCLLILVWSGVSLEQLPSVRPIRFLALECEDRPIAQEELLLSLTYRTFMLMKRSRESRAGALSAPR